MLLTQKHVMLNIDVIFQHFEFETITLLVVTILES